MTEYYHAHKIISEKCNGHMACMRHCPTQAIRVRGGKARISEDLCVDCGICISVCPSNAVVPMSDPVGEISHFKYKVVVPSPVLYAQFDSRIHPQMIRIALKRLGFDEVVDVTPASRSIDRALVKYLKNYRGRLPLISSYCPSTLRLIQVKYPDLVEQVVPFDVPREVTAREIRANFPARLGLQPDDIGIVYIAPCPAIIVSIKQPAEKARSWIDGVVSLKDVYSALFPLVVTVEKEFREDKVPEDFSFFSGWSTLGGLARTGQMGNWLPVSSMDHTMQIFDDIENSRLRNVDFVEPLSCMLGCNGGPFTVENPYVARTNSIKQHEKYESPFVIADAEIEEKLKTGYYFFENPVLPRATKHFDTDLETSIKRMKERERVYQKLRQINCGCCGSPTCMAFAEDFVRGEVELTDCIFLAELGGEKE